MPRTTKPSLDDLRTKLSAADSMLDHGLRAINQGSRLDAMETVYAASCLIEEIVAALESSTSVEKPVRLFKTPTARLSLRG